MIFILGMNKSLQGVFFNLISYKDTGTYIISGVDEIQALLDGQIVKIQSMRASPFIKPFEARSSEWETMLSTLQVIIDRELHWRKPDSLMCVYIYKCIFIQSIYVSSTFAGYAR